MTVGEALNRIIQAWADRLDTLPGEEAPAHEMDDRLKRVEEELAALIGRFEALEGKPTPKLDGIPDVVLHPKINHPNTLIGEDAATVIRMHLEGNSVPNIRKHFQAMQGKRISRDQVEGVIKRYKSHADKGQGQSVVSE